MFAKAYELEIPVSASLELLDMCNLKCEHCYLPTHNDWGLTTKQVKEIVDEMKKVGVLNVTLTGGEIFVRKDIFDIVEYIRKLNMRVFLLTNATLLSEESIIKLKKMNVAQVSTSLFSMNPEIHDSITGVAGSWEKLMKNLELLSKNGLTVQVKTPLMNKNKYDYIAIQEYCKQNHFAYKYSARIFSKNDGDNTPKDMRIMYEDLHSIIKDYDQNEGEELFKSDVTCGALRYNFSVNKHGDVFPCISYPVCVGNVFEKSLSDIWNSEEYRRIRNIKKSDVEDCKTCDLKAYCKRCPAMAYRDQGDFGACDQDAKAWAECRKDWQKV